MTLTVTPTGTSPIDVARTPGRATTMVMIGAPLAMALGRALIVPLDVDEWDATLSDIAAHHVRSDLGWTLTLAASALLAMTAALLAIQLLSTRTKSARFAIGATALGWAGCGANAAVGLILTEMAKAPNRSEQVELLTAFNDGSWTYLFLLQLVGVIGYAVLAVALVKARIVATGAAVLIGIGGAATLVTMTGPMTVLLVLTAVVLAAGHVLALRSMRIGRMSGLG